MNIKAILFDLDGTLLPMNQDEFIKCYFKLLAQKLAPHGYEPKQLIDAVWSGTAAMVGNDGLQTNEAVFWNHFSGIYGTKVYEDKPKFDEFYENEFEGAKAACGYAAQAIEVITAAKERGFRVVLATNPIFPAKATENRIRWAGLMPESFEIYTTYENSYRCKPSHDYYRDILKQLELLPEECLMVGNDVWEDMIAKEIGMNVFLLTDCMINTKGKDISEYPQGNFSELLEYINSI